MSYYLYALIYYSCLMNSTPSADQLKKKKKKKLKRKTSQRGSHPN